MFSFNSSFLLVHFDHKSILPLHMNGCPTELRSIIVVQKADTVRGMKLKAQDSRMQQNITNFDETIYENSVLK